MAKTTQVALSRRRGRQILDILLPTRKGFGDRSPRGDGGCALFRGAFASRSAQAEGSHPTRGGRFEIGAYADGTEREGAALGDPAVLDTYFGGSPEQAVAALLDVSSTRLNQEDLNEKAKKEAGKSRRAV